MSDEPDIESTDPPGDNVIALEFSPIGISTGRLIDRYCSHSHSIVDNNARIVKCRACGAELDPIAVLWQLAHKADSFRWMAEEKRRLEARVAELKKEEVNIKARIRNARKWEP